MNLEPLFQMQKELDAHIEQQHPREEGEDRLAKKTLALQVELGELANELPEVFKFWSNKKNSMERALEEYVDCLHFILSIGLEHEFDEIVPVLAIEPLECSDIVRQLTLLMRTDWEIYEEGDGAYYHEGLEMFVGLGNMLGFTWEQIEEAYKSKNGTNHQRQVEGY